MYIRQAPKKVGKKMLVLHIACKKRQTTSKLITAITSAMGIQVKYSTEKHYACKTQYLMRRVGLS